MKSQPQPRGPGAPPGNTNAATDHPADSIIHIRVRRAQKGEYVRASRRKGLSLSAWILSTLDNALK